MSIWEKMNDLTRGKIEKQVEQEKELTKPQVGDILTGVINNLRREGYGFITSEQLPFERIYFHWTGLRQDTSRFPQLRKRMKVEFQLQHDTEKGYKAIKIKVM